MNLDAYIYDYNISNINVDNDTNNRTHPIPQMIRDAKGDKYSAALRWQLHVVSPEWALNSVKKGFMLDPVQYRVGDPNDLASGSTLNSSTTSIASTVSR